MRNDPKNDADSFSEGSEVPKEGMNQTERVTRSQRFDAMQNTVWKTKVLRSKADAECILMSCEM